MQLLGGKSCDQTTVSGATRHEGLFVCEGLLWTDLSVDPHGPGPASAAHFHTEEAVGEGHVQGVAEGEGGLALLPDLALCHLWGRREERK